MAGFKTHITVSTAVGVAYGAAGRFLLDDPSHESLLPACLLAGGLCSVSGMLPDLDSGPGVPLRESVAFAAAVIPMLLLERFRQIGLPPETVALAGGAIYLAIRFGAGKLFAKCTVHRGMFHSIPALAIAGQVAYLICAHEDTTLRLFIAGGVMLGFASHLILDEIWSIDFKRLRLKSSFGTAVKLWGDCWWANLLSYIYAVVLALLITQDRPLDQKKIDDREPDNVARERMRLDMR